MNRTYSLVVVLLASSVMADEGMWTFESLPAKKMQAAYGFVPDAKWLEHARLASLQFNGNCSGSFVSPSGLIMTNHHCIDDCLRSLGELKKTNYSEKPFVAKAAGAEIVCPDTEALQLLSTEDVTSRVQAATKGVSPEKFHDAMKVIRNQLEKTCVGADEASVECDVRSMYQGGQYLLFRFRRYTDIRMVFAPELAVASFGGDPDNFSFPRYNLDASFLRAYENGKPASTPMFFSWRTEGAKAGEEVFVTGHPGGTDRLLTVAQLEYQVRVSLPRRLEELAYQRGMLHEFARSGARAKELATVPLNSVENSIKVSRGEREALLEPRLLEQKRKEEAALRQAIAQDPVLSKDVGDPWSEISAALAKDQVLRPRREALALRSELLSMGTGLVRAAAQRALPENERFHEFADRALPSLGRSLMAPNPLFPELEERSIAHGLARLREVLGADDPQVKAVLGRRSPEAIAKDAAKNSKLFDPKVRKALWEGGQAAVDASKDPVVVLAKSLDAEQRRLRKLIEVEVQGPLKQASERVAKAYFAMHKNDTYPDATFTLRLSYGAVRGWVKDDGSSVAPFTFTAGLFERATGEDPYQLPPSWVAAKAKLDPKTPFNFITDNDIVGGNSGSPMIDQQGRVVGLAFDGNRESIGGSYWFDEKVNRCVGVHPAAIVEALRVVYGATALADELTRPVNN